MEQKYVVLKKLEENQKTEKIDLELANIIFDNSETIKEDVMKYVYMVMGLGPNNNFFNIHNSQTGQVETIQIDRTFMESIEKKLELKTFNQKQAFREVVLTRYISWFLNRKDKNSFFSDFESKYVINTIIKSTLLVRMEKIFDIINA